MILYFGEHTSLRRLNIFVPFFIFKSYNLNQISYTIKSMQIFQIEDTNGMQMSQEPQYYTLCNVTYITSITYNISYTRKFLRIIFRFSATIINIGRNRNFIATNTQIRTRNNKQTTIIYVKHLNWLLKELSRIGKVNETKKKKWKFIWIYQFNRFRKRRCSVARFWFCSSESVVSIMVGSRLIS